jgi:transcriptional regulator with XRE-family HTH domain
MKHDPDPRKQYGRTIRSIRQKAGYSQEKLAELSSLHRTYVGAVERGERNVSLLNIVALAQALDVPVSRTLRGIS